MKTPLISQFSGRIKKMRIISRFACYGGRLLAYDETEQRITINDCGQVWLTRYDRAPNPFYPDQMYSKQYFRLSPESTNRIIDAGTEFFCQYKYQSMRDSQKWCAYLENTEGKLFYTEGTRTYEYPLDTRNLTDAIREELGIQDLLLVGNDTWDEENWEDPVPCWYESASFEEVFQQAEIGLDSDHDRRVELLRALEYHYWDYEGPDVEKIKRIQRLMHRYVLTLESERAVKEDKNSFTWEELAEDEE